MEKERRKDGQHEVDPAFTTGLGLRNLIHGFHWTGILTVNCLDVKLGSQHNIFLAVYPSSVIK